MDKFVCKGCAKCCNAFGVKGLPLFEFEVEKIKKLYSCPAISPIARVLPCGRNSNLNIRPTEVFLDEISGKKFAVLYGMFQEPCPFLKDNKCSIYDERFLICRQFPVFSTAKFKFAKVKGVPEFMQCKNFDSKKELSKFLGNQIKDVSEVENYLKETYENCFEFAKKSNEETERIMNTLIELENSGKIKLKSVDYRSLKNDEEVLRFSEFLNQT